MLQISQTAELLYRKMTIINHARKSLLFNKQQQTWIKKENGLFDVTMGAYDLAEVCELVGSFLLYTLSLKYNKTNLGLYRDDGFAVFRNVIGMHCEKIKKEFQKLFRQYGLELIIKCNLRIVDFLDITLNLTTLLTNLTISLMMKFVIFIRNQTTHLQ